MLALLLTFALADTPISALAEDLRPPFEAAESAWRAGDRGRAEQGYAYINDNAPDFDRAWRRRCGVELEQGKIYEAIDHCRKAVELQASIENRTGLAIALVRPAPEDPPGHRSELDEARKLLMSVIAEEPDYLYAWQAMCAWSVEALDDDGLDECLRVLGAADPDNPGTLYFKSVQLMSNGELDEATRTLRRARQRGLPDHQFRPIALRLGLAGLEADPDALRQARALAQGDTTAKVMGTWSDILPFGIAALLLLSVGLLAFAGGTDEEDPPA